MQNRTCSVDGCGRPHVARGYCSGHYQRVRANGDPGGAVLREMGRRTPGATCVVDGCDRPVLVASMGACEAHYRRWRKRGDFGSPEVRDPWDGETLTYRQAHIRVQRARGRAADHECVSCGRPAQDWAYDHTDPDELREDNAGRDPRFQSCDLTYSRDVWKYEPMCKSCHVKADMARGR